MTKLPDLYPRWQAWCKLAHANRSARAVYERLQAAYAEPQRHYHTLAHIEHVLLEFDAARQLARDPAAVEMASWFHDAVYDTRYHDNEARSAELAAAACHEMGLPDEFSARVATMIRATTHVTAPQDIDTQLAVDTDLSMLAVPPPVFAKLSAAVRAEYAWVPDAAYEIERRRILRNFYDRPRIYFSDFFYRRHEAQARRNLAAALA